jgi:hypothetical protein
MPTSGKHLLSTTYTLGTTPGSRKLSTIQASLDTHTTLVLRHNEGICLTIDLSSSDIHYTRRHTPCHSEPLHSIAILRTCQALATLGSTILYGSNNFFFSTISTLSLSRTFPGLGPKIDCKTGEYINAGRRDIADLFSHRQGLGWLDVDPISRFFRTIGEHNSSRIRKVSYEAILRPTGIEVLGGRAELDFAELHFMMFKRAVPICQEFWLKGPWEVKFDNGEWIRRGTLAWFDIVGDDVGKVERFTRAVLMGFPMLRVLGLENAPESLCESTYWEDILEFRRLMFAEQRMSVVSEKRAVSMLDNSFVMEEQQKRKRVHGRCKSLGKLLKNISHIGRPNTGD